MPFCEKPDEQSFQHFTLPDDDFIEFAAQKGYKAALFLDFFVEKCDINAHDTILSLKNDEVTARTVLN
jgi:hypothetical protein